MTYRAPIRRKKREGQIFQKFVFVRFLKIDYFKPKELLMSKLMQLVVFSYIMKKKSLETKASHCPKYHQGLLVIKY